jgi:hypothetical protein
MKNIGGLDFTDLSTTIETDDPYITITDDSGYFGSLLVDSTKENTDDPYTLTANAAAPNGHVALLQVIATDGSFSDTLNLSLVIGQYHYYVWNPDPTPSSGEAIHAILSSTGFAGAEGLDLPMTDLDNYMALFVCVGIYANNYRILAGSQEAAAIVSFINNGGRVYLEGGDVWYYDPPTGYDFGPLFGINAVADGTSDLGPVIGEEDAFTLGMSFNYGGENSWIDHINPIGTGFLIFHDGDQLYNCGVANDPGTYKTVGTSFELGNLIDGTGVSTRAVLLDEIMNFFGIATGVEERTIAEVLSSTTEIFPNPVAHVLTIKWRLPGDDHVNVRIFDAAGRLVRQFPSIYCAGSTNHTVTWDRTDNRGMRVPRGIYFIRLQGSTSNSVRKVIVL